MHEPIFESAKRRLAEAGVEPFLRSRLIVLFDLIRDLSIFANDFRRLQDQFTDGDIAVDTRESADALASTIRGLVPLVNELDAAAETPALLDIYAHLVQQLSLIKPTVKYCESFKAHDDGLRLTQRITEAENFYEGTDEVLRQLLDLRNVARTAATEAEASADTARAEAGATGDLKLAHHFSEYASDEVRRSNWFRIAAFVATFTAALVGAIMFFRAEDSEPVSDHVARALIVLAIAGIGTYCARLAAQHRHDGNWAATVAVQLKEYSRFMEPITDDAARADIHRAFAARVLGALPIAGEVPSPQVSDQVINALLSRRD